MKIKKLLLTVVLLTFSSKLLAATDDGWVLLAGSEKGGLYAFPDSIATDEFGNKLIWLKMINPKLKDGVKVSKSLNVFDCDTKKHGISHVIQYDINGNVTNEFSRLTTIAAVNTIEPDGFYYAVMKSLCP